MSTRHIPLFFIDDFMDDSQHILTGFSSIPFQEAVFTNLWNHINMGDMPFMRFICSLHGLCSTLMGKLWCNALSLRPLVHIKMGCCE